MLQFSTGKDNAKLKKLEKKTGKVVYSLDLSAGKSCPHAKICKSMVIKTDDGLRIKDGKDCQFRCFAASQEVLFTHVYNRRYNNFIQLKQAKTIQGMKALILKSLPKDAEIIRLHVSGDFFNVKYFEAAIAVAKETPHIRWYGYTKAIHSLHAHTLPDNLRLVASFGGKYDDKIANHTVSCQVVYSRKEARDLGLPIDNNDYHAYNCKKSFAVLIHGTQPKGSDAGKALVKLRKNK